VTDAKTGEHIAEVPMVVMERSSWITVNAEQPHPRPSVLDGSFKVLVVGS